MNQTLITVQDNNNKQQFMNKGNTVRIKLRTLKTKRSNELPARPRTTVPIYELFLIKTVL